MYWQGSNCNRNERFVAPFGRHIGLMAASRSDRGLAAAAASPLPSLSGIELEIPIDSAFCYDA
jgi:hypothetical protein